MYITLWAAAAALLCHLYPHCPSVLSVPFSSPRAISHRIRKKIRAGRSRNAWHSLLVSFLICTCAHSHNTHVYTSTHTHSDHTRSLLFYGHSSSSSALAGWILFDFLFDSIKLLVCVPTTNLGFAPFVVFIPFFSYYFLNRKFRLSDAAQTSGPPFPSVHSDGCVGAAGIRPHFCPPHYTIFWGLSGIKISWEPLENDPLTGQMLLLCPAIVVRKIKNVFPISKSL